MDFKKLLDTYSDNVDTIERSNIFAQNPPEPNIDEIRDFVTSYDSNAAPEDDNEETPTPEEPTPEPIEISDDVLSALSDLDDFAPEPPAEEETPEPTLDDSVDPFEAINAEIENLANADDSFADSTDDINLEDLADNLADSFADSTDDINLEDLADNFVDSTDDINLEDLADNFDETTDDINLEDNFVDSTDDINLEDLADNFDETTDDINLDDINIDDIGDDNLADNLDETADDINIDDIGDDNFDETADDINLDDINLDDINLDDINIDDIGDDDDLADNLDETTDDINLEDINTDDIGEAQDDATNTLGFDIELPEEFKDEVEEEVIDETEEEEIPDFTDTEMDDTEIKTPIIDENVPTEYESVDKSINFDVWGQTTPKEELIELTEEQSFKIRYKINSLSDQNIRFRIREILADAASHEDVYPNLMSLLLVDAPESTIVSFLEKLEDEQVIDGFQFSDIPEYTSTFLAKDVVDYQDTIYRIKTEFTYNLKKYAIYAIIALLSGIIAWLGIAQPLRVNSLFERGLVAIQLDNYIEGEALFQQANSIAGEPVAEWYMKYADVYKTKNLVTEAGNKYLSALVIEPKNITIAMHASDFYTNLGPRYFSNAIRIMENLTTYHPKTFTVWDYLGMLYVDYSEFYIDNNDVRTETLYKAIDVYQKYLLNSRNNPAPFYRMLDIYIKIGNSEQINRIAVFLDDLDPKHINVEIMSHLGKYYTDNRNLAASDQVFRKLTPILDQYHEDIEPLQKYMERLYNINPENISNILSESYHEFARYKMLSSDFKLAGTLLTNSLKFNDQNEDSYNLLGEAYLRSKEATRVKLRNAKNLFDSALALNPNNYKSHINLGHLYYVWDSEFGDVNVARNSALYHYRYATSLMPPNTKNSLLSYNHGWLEFQNDNADRAIEIWSDIYKNNPENSIISYALGSALYQIDNPQLAQVILEKSANNLEALKDGIAYPDINNRRHREVFTQLAKTYNNIGVINANYGVANQGRREDFEAKALMNFYKAQDLSDQLGRIYSTTEYNIGVLTRQNISNRRTVFDEDIPKHTSLENPTSQFNHLLLENI